MASELLVDIEQRPLSSYIAGEDDVSELLCHDARDAVYCLSHDSSCLYLKTLGEDVVARDAAFRHKI